LSRLADNIGRRPVLLASLLGAACANVLQGVCTNIPKPWGFWVFLFARGFSGVWAAVGATCNVYITDVVPEEARAGYMAKLALIVPLAILFGPGLGGGLSKLGLNAPVLVDGSLTFVVFVFVFFYLPETPAFLKIKQERQEAKPGEQPEKAKTPWVVHLIGFSSLVSGFVMSTRLVCCAILLRDRYQWDALRVGFLFAAVAILMMASTAFICPLLRKLMPLAGMLTLGRIVAGLCYLSFVMWLPLPVILVLFGVIGLGDGITSASFMAYVVGFTQASNRGTILGTVQAYQNLGRMLGPVVATHLAQYFGAGTGPDALGAGAAFGVAGGLCLVTAAVPLIADRCKPVAKGAQIKRKETGYGEDWLDEEGQPGDVEVLGRYMADLLQKRHYKWVSRREEVELFLSRIIPEIHTSDREAYESHWSEVLQEDCHC